MWAQRRFKLVCTSAQSEKSSLASSDNTGFKVSSDEQWRFRSACVDAQANLRLCWEHMSECLNPHVALYFRIQYNLNGSNPDGSSTVDDSSSFFSPYKILQIAQENKYLGILFSYFIMELYVVCIH